MAAIDACLTSGVIVLPNDKDVVMAARQAAEHSTKTVKIVATTSMPQGVAAIVALNPEVSLEENTIAMEDARQRVCTIEVERAVRPAVIDGVPVRVGQAMALRDGKVCIARNSLRGAALSCLSETVTPQTSLVTIYYGDSVKKKQAQALGVAINRKHSHLEETEVIGGGQSRPPLIISVE
jgi:hypothetical protein